jgi:hypothetical protein
MKIGFALAGLFSFLAAGRLAGVPVDPVNLQPAPTPTLSAPEAEATPPLTPCEQAMIKALDANSWGVPAYTTAVDGGSWSLTGVTGSLREWQWDSYRDGPVFDLVQVYYQHGTMRHPLWAAVGVTMPPYYTVHDSASLEYYKQQGHGGHSYYVSFVEGAETRQEVLALFSQPGKYRVTLQVEGSRQKGSIGDAVSRAALNTASWRASSRACHHRWMISPSRERATNSSIPAPPRHIRYTAS